MCAQMMACIMGLIAALVAVLAAVFTSEDISWWDALQVSIVAGFMLLFAVVAVHCANQFKLTSVRPVCCSLQCRWT